MNSLQEILNTHFSGELDQTLLYVRLSVYAVGVLFTGLVLWRITVIFMQKNTGILIILQSTNPKILIAYFGKN